MIGRSIRHMSVAYLALAGMFGLLSRVLFVLVFGGNEGSRIEALTWESDRTRSRQSRLTKPDSLRGRCCQQAIPLRGTLGRILTVLHSVPKQVWSAEASWARAKQVGSASSKSTNAALHIRRLTWKPQTSSHCQSKPTQHNIL